MRVVHFGYSDFRAGAARASYRLHSALVEQGVDSRMLVAEKLTADERVTGPAGRCSRWWAEQAAHNEFRAKRMLETLPGRLKTPRRPHTSLAVTGSGLVRQIDRLAPDVVQLHWLGLGLVRPEGLTRLAPKPIVWRLADMWPMAGAEHLPDDQRFVTGYPRGGRDGGSGLDVDRWVFQRKNSAYERLPNLTVVAPSNWMAEQCRRSALLRDRRVEVIATGVDTRTFVPLDRRSLRDALGIGEERVIAFGAVASTTDRNKGWHHLAKALEILARLVDPDRVHVLVFGHDRAVQPELPFRATFLGNVSEGEMPNVYSTADVFVCPSERENMPNTAIEAQACGVPVVAFRVGGLPDIVDDSTGYLAVPYDAADLAHGMRSLVEEAEPRRLQRRAHVRGRAVMRFDARRQANRYADLYAELSVAGRG